VRRVCNEEALLLVPGTGGKFACGGLWAELKPLILNRSAADVVTTVNGKGTLFIDDLLKEKI